MFHGTLTFITPLRPGTGEEEVRVILSAWDERIQQRLPQPFQRMDAIYFAHWALSPDGRELIFGVDLRLPRSLRGQRQLRAAVSLFVQQLAADVRQTGDRSFDALYAHCQGYPEGGLDAPEQVERFLLSRALPYKTRHVDFAYRVASVPALRDVLSLRQQTDAYLNNPQRRAFLERQDTASVHKALRTSLAREISRVSTPEWERNQSAAQREAALATLAYQPVDGPLRWLIQLRYLFVRPGKTTGSIDVPDAKRAQIEARQGPLQNSMVLVTDLPKQWIHRLQQYFIMWLINWRLVRNVLGMNDIRAIHFARWVRFRRGHRRQLLFIVTYDESWDAYIDSFVNHEDVGTFLRLIWSKSVGFPQGRPFVEPFKQWIRSVQCPTLLHYSALLHGEAPAAPVALTDLHEAFTLRQSLTEPELRGPGGREALSTFLTEGRSPYQDKLLSPRRAIALLLGGLRALFRRPPSPPAVRSTAHVLAHELDRPRPSGPVRAHFAPASGHPREPGRRPGGGGARLQAHAGRRLPGAED